ncbi:PREDICTED: uncharacterized protein LOC105462605 [Wasmannia auropunctata]|uniref:uncharacterized protein LOC105462605 n=1 Tax=Wasmannia auropunctata TaxID=64793 RepID=UPI0005EFC5A4|nr:PREDICTED: uncharacterized protein LOC105462605 [Wasmannia auropunctata]
METIEYEMNGQSGDPADHRRCLTGLGSVKCATGHVRAAYQAAHGNYATGAKGASIRRPRRIGTWNVRGLRKDGKLQIVEGEMQRNNIHLLGLNETHWQESGHFTSSSGSTIYHSGGNGSSKGHS